MKPLTIAIDGPSGAGKGTVARAIAAKLGYRHVDSGAMYRAVGWKALQEGAPVIPCGLDTFGWSPRNRRKCAVVWGEPMRLDDLPRNRRGYAEAVEVVSAEIVRLWRLAAEASAAGLPPELPDGAKRSGINPKIAPSEALST